MRENLVCGRKFGKTSEMVIKAKDEEKMILCGSKKQAEFIHRRYGVRTGYVKDDELVIIPMR